MIKFIEKFRKDTASFELVYRLNLLLDCKELMLRSKGEGKHFAVHTRFNLLSDEGAILESKPIDDAVAKFIIEHFESRGDTESFNVYKSDLDVGYLSNRKRHSVDPTQVRHKLTNTEHSFTATGEKLHFHWPIFEKFRDTKYGSIIRATMTLHQVCSSHCHYCSTIARNKKDSISLEEAKDFVRKLYFDQASLNKDRFQKYNDSYRAMSGSDIRLRGLILSGGGQPNLWPHFVEFVEWLSELDIDLGLITNGFPKKIPDEIYNKFKWIRISVTPEDASPHYPEKRFDLQYLPETIINNPNVTVGYSYVYGSWTSDDILARIDASIMQNGFDYCRMLTDCNLTRNAQLRAHQLLAERLHTLGFIDAEGSPLRRIFHQLKYHGTPEEAKALWYDSQCYLQTYNVFWDTTGHEDAGHSFCYACDSITVLAEETSDTDVSASERKFDHNKWGLVPNTEVERLYREPVTPYFDPRSVCSACLFMRNNKAVKDIISLESFELIKLPAEIAHVNFP